MRITKIQIKHFRAFRGEYEITLRKGQNLLIYGENGSGKSSLYQALDSFLAPPTPYLEHKNIFAGTDNGYVKLEISDGMNPSQTYEWEETGHPFTEPLIAQAAKTRGFLDYRALLETHYAHRQADGVNVFNLLVTSLLANVENPISQRTFGAEWDSIKQVLAQRRDELRNQRLESELTDFNLGLTSILSSLTTQANAILATFEQDCAIQLALAPEGLQLSPDKRALAQTTILLTAIYYQRPIPGHHHFLNEARLSAIAISIYLGALLLNPAGPLPVLFLDDVLIGLDMSNRLPLLDVLLQHFKDWQVFLTTFDRVWFEMVSQRVQHQAPSWERIELYCGRTNEGDMPIYRQSKDYLGAAEEHLLNSDFKAAALYIRSAYERLVIEFCGRHRLLVRYCESPKGYKSDDFWTVVKTREYKTGERVLSTSLVDDIEMYRSSILNQLSHTEPSNVFRREVKGALDAVTKLRTSLEAVDKNSLK